MSDRSSDRYDRSVNRSYKCTCFNTNDSNPNIKPLRPYKKDGHTMATSLSTGGIPWLRPYKQEGHTLATSLQTEGTYLGYVPTNRRDIPWFSCSVSSLSPLMSGFDPRLVYMGFMVFKVAFSFFSKYLYFLGHEVAQFVGALRHKQEGHGFDSRWRHWNSSLT